MKTEKHFRTVRSFPHAASKQGPGFGLKPFPCRSLCTVFPLYPTLIRLIIIKRYMSHFFMEVFRKMVQKEHTIIIGAGPCGMAAAIALKEKGIDPLIIEKGNIVQTIYHFPTHQTFFSSAQKLEIGNIPFTTASLKPVRNDALAYYREVALRKELRIHPYEQVFDIVKEDDYVFVNSRKMDGTMPIYHADNVIIATGYYDQPNYLQIPGENLPNVMHYFKEAHPYFQNNVVVIGGKNSAVDAAIELAHAGASVTVLYRGSTYSTSVKPWILPTFESHVNNGKINMVFNAQVQSITVHNLTYVVGNESYTIDHDFVFAMTGYEPNIRLMEKIGIEVDRQSGRPTFHPDTFETNIPNIYVAGVVISGYNGNETFIENGRFHGEKIAQAIHNNE